MTDTPLPEIWEWAEYYCPFCYVATVRFHAIMPEYQGRLRLRIRPFPLEVLGSGPPDRGVLEQEWWLCALQEPAALADLSRTDAIVSPDGEVHFLEVNVSPGLTETSMFPMAVEAAGHDLGEVLGKLLARRAGSAR